MKISKVVYDNLVAHAREGFPLEVCGILGGREGVVSTIYRMTNTDQSNEHYMMDPKEQFAVVKDLRARGLEMQAIYHSHPETPARPSEEDIRLALTPGVSHVIVSLADELSPQVCSYLISGATVVSEVLEVLSD